MTAARSWRVTVPGMTYSAAIAPDRATTHEEAADVFRRTMPQLDSYTIAVHRLGDHRDTWRHFPPIREVAA